jgi:hypothetical protein
MTVTRPISQNFPPVALVQTRLADAERDVELLRALLRIAQRAENYRRADKEAPALNRQLAKMHRKLEAARAK